MNLTHNFRISKTHMKIKTQNINMNATYSAFVLFGFNEKLKAQVTNNK
jgi:hypothetical protein